MSSFDWRVLHICEFELLDKHNESYGCGEPALYEVSWIPPKPYLCEITQTMKVCQKHFDLIKNTENGTL